MTEPLISVVTPAYNVGNYLGEAIGSVRRQSHQNWEHLIVDDGSSDTTGEVALAAAEQDDRIRVMTIAHAGSSAARNAGIDASRGPYIAFLDGDDRWEPGFLRVLLAQLRAAPPGVRAVFCRSQGFSDDNPRLGLHTFAPGPYDLRRMLTQWNPTANGSSLLLRADALREAGPFREDLSSAVDLEMWLRMLAVAPGYQFLGLPDVLTGYRHRTGSISADTTGRFEALNTILGEFGSRLTPAERRCYAYPVLMGLSVGRRREAAELFWAARPVTHPSWLADREWRHAVVRMLLNAFGGPVEEAAHRTYRRIQNRLGRLGPAADRIATTDG